MSRPRHLTVIALVGLLSGAGPATIARAAPAASPAPKKGAAPKAPARFDVAHGLCKQFLDLPTDLRGMVVAWAAGRYHRLDRWVLEEETARKVVAGVEHECEATPDGLFRYKVVAEVKKLK